MATKTYYNPQNGQHYYSGSKKGAFYWDAPESQKDESYINQYNYTPSYNAYRQYLEELRRQQEEEERRRQETLSPRIQVQDGQNPGAFDTQAARAKAEDRVRFEQAYNNYNAEMEKVDPNYAGLSANEKYNMFAKQVKQDQIDASRSQGMRDWAKGLEGDPDFDRMSEEEKRRQYLHNLDRVAQENGTLPEDQRAELSEYLYSGLSDKEKQAVDAIMDAENKRYENYDKFERSGSSGIFHGLLTGEYNTDYEDEEKAAIEELRKQGWDEDTIKKEVARYKELADYRMTQAKNAEMAIDSNASAGEKALKSTFNTAYGIYNAPTRGLESALSYLDDSAYGKNTSSKYALSSNRSEEGYRQVRENAIGNEHPIGQVAYDIGVSTAESLYTMLLTNAAAGLVGVAGAGTALKSAQKAGKAVTTGMKVAAGAEKALEVATLVPFSANAYDSAYREAVNRGFSEGQAQGYGIAVGGIEALTEMFSLDKAWKLAEGTKIGRNLFASAAIQAGIEGSEEVASEFGQRFADYVAVKVGKTGKTQEQLDLEEFMSQGMSREEATREVAKKFAKDVGMAALSGTISGGFTTAGAAAVGAYRSKYGNNLTEAIADKYKNLEVKGDTKYEQQLRADKERYENNPTQYIVDQFKVNNEEDAKTKQVLQEIADKEKAGKKLSVSDKSFITEYVIANKDQFDNEYIADLFDLGEDRVVPYEYRDVKKNVSEDEARSALAQAAKDGDADAFIDAMNLTRNSTNKAVAEKAEEIISDYAGMAQSHGITQETIGNAVLSMKRAYIAGLNGEQLNKEAMPDKVRMAYNDGMKDALQQKSRTIVENTDALKTDITTKEGNTVTLDGEFTPEGIMTDGGVVSIDKLELDESKAVDKAYHYADKYESVNVKNNFLNNIKDGQNIEIYKSEYGKVYDSALAGLSLDNVKKQAYVELENDQIENIYDTAVVERQARAADTLREALNGVKGVGKGKAYNESSSTDPKMLKIASMLARGSKWDIHIVDEVPQNKNAQGAFVKKENAIYVRADDFMRSLGHEISHYVESYNKGEYDAVRNAVANYVSNKIGSDAFMGALKDYGLMYEGGADQDLSADDLSGEMFNDIVPMILESKQGSKAFAKYLAENYGAEEAMSFGEKIKDVIDNLAGTIRKYLSNTDHPTAYAKEMKKYADELGQFADQFIKALDGAIQNYNNGVQGESAGEVDDSVNNPRNIDRLSLSEDSTGRELSEEAINKDTEPIGIHYDGEMVYPVRFSYGTWNESDYQKDRKNAAKDLSKALGISQRKALKYIDDINSIAKIIADDRIRLDYISDEGSAVVSNADYGASVDFSTICKKRLLYTGTLQQIQKQIGNRVITVDDYLDIRQAMIRDNKETTCGCCYVEGSRAKLGTFMKEFIKKYAKTKPDYVPTMYDVSTPDGIRELRKNHPEVFEARQYFLNHYGRIDKNDKALFASQQKPKDYTERKAYKGEILKMFKNKPAKVAEKNLNGGLRLQSFSDFEVVNLLDLMQVITDMSRVNLAGQAYTKVRNFADAVGNTGLKINLSLMAKSVDKNGNLVLDEINGMKRSDAEYLRNKYSKNVGTIIVCFNDEQIKAAMKDDFIDFIIPFHRSQWQQSQYEALGLPENTRDYTNYQEDGVINEKGRRVRADHSYMSKEYWDFSKSGRENAETYINMCNENNKVPVFDFLLEKDSNGKYHLPKGADGYFKLLIDFKMYDNNGVGSPQMPVHPDFSLEECQKMLMEYEGGHESFPVDQKIADEFTKKIKKREKEFRFSISENSRGKKLTKDQQKYFKDESSELLDEQGRLKVMYHGTPKANFTIFDPEYSDDNISLFYTDNFYVAAGYAGTDSYVDPYNLRKPVETFDDLAKRFEDTDWGVREENGQVIIENIEDPDDPMEYVRADSAKDAYQEWIDQYAWDGEEGEFGGIYDVYLKVTNPLVIDAEGNDWKSIYADNIVDEEADAYDMIHVIKKNDDGSLKVEWRLKGGNGGGFTVMSQDAFKEKFGEDLYEKMVTDGYSYQENVYVNPNKDAIGSDTRDLAKYAKKNGYDALVINNVRDNGEYARSNTEKSQVVVVFNSNQVKSVDNLHPTDNSDIRYSITKNSKGEDLTEGQQKYFRNSQNLDDEHRLKVMYHGARGAGFTVFDTRHSDDNKSLFFTDDPAVAKSYIGTYEKFKPLKPMSFDELASAMEGYTRGEIYLEEDGDDVVIMEVGTIQDGDHEVYRGDLKGAQEYFVESIKDLFHNTDAMYEVYLNIKNPLVIDADYNNWDEIPVPDDFYGHHYQNFEIHENVDNGYDVNYEDENGIHFETYETFDEIEKKYGLDYNDLDFDFGEIYINSLYLDQNGRPFPTNTRMYSQYAQENGYDGVIFKNIIDTGIYATNEEKIKASTVAIVYSPEQAKDIDNLNPTENSDIRYSITENSDGEELTEGQQRYFNRSQNLDDEHRLMVMYHGTEVGGFTVFDPSYSDDEISLFFTDNEDVAKSYIANGSRDRIDVYKERKVFDKPVSDEASIKEVLEDRGYTDISFHEETFLNGSKVRYWDFTTPYGKEVKKFQNKDMIALANAERRGEQSGVYPVYLNTVNPLKVDAQKRHFDDIRFETEEGQLNTTREIAEYAKDHGYDSVIFKNLRDNGGGFAYDVENSRKAGKPSTVVICFSPEQVKSVNNLNPTSSKDIRYALVDDDWVNFDEILGSQTPKDDARTIDILKRGMEAMKNQEVDMAQVRRIATKLRNEYGSSYNINRLTADLIKAFAYMQSEDHVDYPTMMGILKDIARPVVEESGEKVGEQEYKDFLEYFKGKKIKLTSTQKQEVRERYGSYKEFRNAMMPITISDNADSTLDQLWDEMVKETGYVLDIDANEGDMPVNLLDTLQAMRPTVRNDFNGDIEDVAKDLAMRIVEEYIEGEAQKEMSKEIKEIRNRIKKGYQERYKNYRGKANAEILARNKRRGEEAKERQQVRDLKHDIKINANKLLRWVEKPTEGKSVPHDMMVPVLQFLNAIDFVDPVITVDENGKFHTRVFDRVDYEDGHKKFIYHTLTGDTREDVFKQFNEAIGRGEGTKEQRSWTEKMQGMREIYDKVLASENFEDTSMDFLMQTLDGEGLTKQFDDLLTRHAGQVSMNQLDSKDLKLIDNIVKNIFHALNQANKAYSQPSTDIVNLAQSTIQDAEGKKLKARSKTGQAVYNFFRINNATPKVFFEVLGRNGNKVYKFLRNALNREILDVKQVSEFMKGVMKGVDASKWTGRNATVHTIPVSHGQIQMTDDQIMSLYETIRRTGGMDRIKGGIEIERLDVKGNRIEQEAIHLTEADIKKIESVLTPEMIEVADKIQKYMANDMSKMGNETSRQLYGYEKFTDPTYYPWRPSRDTIATSNSSENIPMFTSIERSGFTKQLKEGANNPLVIRGIFDVFADHVAEMAAYHGYAAAVKDTLRWLNYREKSESDGFVQWSTTKNAINKIVNSKDGVKYITDLLLDINHARKSDYLGAITEVIMGSYKAAAVGANARVVVQQPTAYFRALDMIDAKYLMMVNPKTAIKNIKKSQEQCPISWWKSQGYYETNLGKPVKELVTGIETKTEKVKDVLMKPAGLADDFTWGFLYTAVEKEQRDKLKGKNLSEEEFRKAVNERFDDVVDTTQVVDSVLHRSAFMRSKDKLNIIQTAFMAEPTKTYNMVMEAIIKDMNEGKIGKRTSRAAAAFLITALVNAAAQSLVDVPRHAGDDDDYWEKFKQYMLSNFEDNVNPFNLLPVLKDVAPDIFKLFTGEVSWNKGSGSRFDTEAVYSLIDMVSAWKKHVSGEGNKTGFGVVMATLKPLSQFTGIPMYNLTRDAVALYNAFFDNIETTVTAGSTAKNEKKKEFVKDVNKEKSEDVLDEGITEALESGISIYDLKSAVQSEYKNKYFDAYSDGDTETANEYANKAARAYARMGLSDEEIDEIINDWKDEIITYSALDKAIASGEGIEEAVKHVQQAKDNDKIVKHIMDRFSETVAYEDTHETESDWRGNVDKALAAVDPTLDFDSANDEAMQKAAEKAAEDAQEAKVKGLKNDFFEAVDSKNGSAGRKALEGLKAEGKDAKSIKSSVSTKYHEDWKNAKTPAEKTKAKSDWKSAYTLINNFFGVDSKDLDKTWNDWESKQ